jgi:hypothetical protein
MASLIVEVGEVVVAGLILRNPPMQQCRQQGLTIQLCHTSEYYPSFSFESEK